MEENEWDGLFHTANAVSEIRDFLRPRILHYDVVRVRDTWQGIHVKSDVLPDFDQLWAGGTCEE